jgi:hypothetical protein
MGRRSPAASQTAADAKAWQEYLDTIRQVSVDATAATIGDHAAAAARYEEVEAWAWRRLQTDLKAARPRLPQKGA